MYAENLVCYTIWLTAIITNWNNEVVADSNMLVNCHQLKYLTKQIWSVLFAQSHIEFSNENENATNWILLMTQFILIVCNVPALFDWLFTALVLHLILQIASALYFVYLSNKIVSNSYATATAICWCVFDKYGQFKVGIWCQSALLRMIFS